MKKISYYTFVHHLPPSLTAILDTEAPSPRILIYRSGRLVASVSPKNGQVRLRSRHGPGDARLRNALATAVKQAQARANDATTQVEPKVIDGRTY